MHARCTTQGHLGEKARARLCAPVAHARRLFGAVSARQPNKLVHARLRMHASEVRTTAFDPMLAHHAAAGAGFHQRENAHSAYHAGGVGGALSSCSSDRVLVERHAPHKHASRQHQPACHGAQNARPSPRLPSSLRAHDQRRNRARSGNGRKGSSSARHSRCDIFSFLGRQTRCGNFILLPAWSSPRPEKRAQLCNAGRLRRTSSDVLRAGPALRARLVQVRFAINISPVLLLSRECIAGT